MTKKVIPDDFFKHTERILSQIDKDKQERKVKVDAENAEMNREWQKLAEIERKRVEQLYPQTLQQSKEIFSWIRQFWSELEPEKLSLLKRLFPKFLEFLNLKIYWDHPTWLYWNRYGRKYMYGPVEVRVAQNPEELAQIGGPDFVDRFHKYLYGGDFWKELEIEMKKEVNELRKNS